MSRRFDFDETPLAGLIRVARRPIADSRGFFSRLFCAEAFKEIGFMQPIAQINHTLTKAQGTLRGMHFQYPPHTETKLVTCIQGEILDVAVDIRKGSATFLQWHAEVLSAENQRGLYIPDGFAHGFQTLSDNCQLLYLHSSPYESEAEGALNALDPELAIDWPLEVSEISERDRNHPLLSPLFDGVAIS